MSEREKLEQAVLMLEAQRAILGDAVVDAALAPLREKLAGVAAAVHKTEHASERKLVTVMFADLSGFTALSEKLDPEQVRKLMNDCFNVLVPIVENYGGVVDKFIGDEIMALFGAPVTHENDPERSLRAALEMKAALADFNKERGQSLGMHFGINTGLVVAGGLGSEGRRQYSVMGDAVNLAARLEDASEAGQILVGPNTHRHTAPLFQFEMLPPIRLKGKAEPVTPYRLLGLKTESGSMRGIAGLRSPLVGRDEEYQSLLSGVRDLSAGKGGVVAICADAGLGKSRLVAEVRQVTQESTRWAEGRALSHADGISYWVVRGVLDSLIGVNLDTSPGEVAAALREFVELHTPETVDDVYCYLARLRDVPLESDAAALLKDLLPEGLRSRMRLAFVDLIRACAQEQPLVLVWEDLHWSDPSSLGLLESLLPLTETIPLLLILVFRAEEGSMWDMHLELKAARGERYRFIELEPLSQAESTKLVENLLRIENLPESVRKLIMDKSEGNPLFLEELLRSLLDTGVVLLEGSRAVATQAILQLEVPDTLHGLVAARIDRLCPADKQVLQTASVIGRVFQQTVLAHLLEREFAGVLLDAALSELQRREFVRWRGELEYIFKHAITHDVTYNSLLMARRLELHRLAAETIESLFPDQLDELAPTLAYHFEAAEAREKAVHYLVLAADRDRLTYANAEAIAFYRAAIEQTIQLYRSSSESRVWLDKLAALYENVGTVLSLTGQVDAAVQSYTIALSHVAETDSVARARLHRRQGIAFNVSRRMEEAVDAYRHAVESLGPQPTEPDIAWRQEWIDLQLDRIWASYFTSQTLELTALVSEARPVIELHGTPTQRERLFESLALIDLRAFRYYRLPDETVNNVRRQIAAAEASGSLQAVGRARVINGFVHLWRDELLEAESLFSQGLKDLELVGDVESQLIGSNYMAVLYRKRGEVNLTREWAERTITLSQGANNMFYMAGALGSRGWAALHAGDETGARVFLEEAKAIMANLKTPFCFLYMAPLLSMAIERRDWPAAIESATMLLHPAQQRMPDAIEAALAQAVQSWDADLADAAATLLAQGVELMRQEAMGYV